MEIIWVTTAPEFSISKSNIQTVLRGHTQPGTDATLKFECTGVGMETYSPKQYNSKYNNSFKYQIT
jgi:hypothetical protein